MEASAPPVQVEAGQRGQRLGRPGEDGYAAGLRLGDQIGEIGQPALPQQVGTRTETGGKRPPYDLLRLGDEEPAMRFIPATQRHIGQADVVVQARVRGVGDGLRQGRRSALRCGRVGRRRERLT